METSNKSNTFRQYVATLVATGTTFAAGLSFGWTSPVEAQIVRDENGECDRGFCVSNGEFAWIATIMAFGSLALGFLAGPLMSRVGRKPAMIIYFVPVIAGWLVLLFARVSWMLFLGRILIGVGIGGGCVIVPCYIGEIAQTSVRGRLLSYFQANVTFGTFTAYLLGYFFTMFNHTLLSSVIVIIYGIAMVFTPESPHYYISKNRQDKAEASLKWLRGSQYNPEKEIVEMIEFQSNHESKGVKALLSDYPSRKAIIIVGCLVIGFQLSGVNAILFYASGIFKEAEINMEPDLAAIFLGVFDLTATLTASVIVDKVGRKILLLISYLIMAVSFIIMGTYFQLQSSSPSSIEGWEMLPVIVLCLFIFLNSFGAAPMTFVMMGELFQQQVKDAAAAIAMTVNHTLSIVVTLLFPFLKTQFGSGVTFFVFSFFNAVSFLFVIFFVLETKGKSFDEIQNMLSKKGSRRDSNKTDSS